MPNKTFHRSQLKKEFNSLCIPGVGVEGGFWGTDMQSRAKKVTRLVLGLLL